MEKTALDKKIRKTLLKPFLSGLSGQHDAEAISEALKRLDERVIGEQLLPEVKRRLLEARKESGSKGWQDPGVVGKQVLLAKVLYISRRISRQEYFFFAGAPVEAIHDSRWTENNCPEIALINRDIEKVRQKYGLTDDEFWKRGKGPKEYKLLNKQYDNVFDKYLCDAFREFNLHDIADLYESDREHYHKLRERGRRSVYHKDETVEALKDIVVECVEDARRAASARAYSAAITLLGAGLEGLLLLRCLRSKQKARRCASTLPKRQRPSLLDDPTKWNFDTLIETCLLAGWLPIVDTEVTQYQPAGLAHILRLMRNYVHPGKQVRERPWLTTDEEDYKDAEAIYLVLLSSVLRSRRI